VILGYFEDGPNMVSMAMNGWGAAEPAWWLNLQADPRALAELAGGIRREVTARAAEGEERERLWQRWRELDANLDSYATRRPRETAVVVLEPAPDGALASRPGVAHRPLPTRPREIDPAAARVVASPIGELESVLRIIGAVAVIGGTILVVLQLRVNAKNVRSRNAFDLISRVIDPSFPRRRHLLYEVAARHAGGDWTGFDRSQDDFEVRNFANIYEQLGLLARKRVIDLDDLLDALSAQPMADWITFEPIRAHIIHEAGQAFSGADNQPGVDAVYWPNFRWLAEESRRWTMQRLTAGAGPQAASAAEAMPSRAES
jgi:deazaflavin-dependent oxidoreductase (nitroreductase family)